MGESESGYAQVRDVLGNIHTVRSHGSTLRTALPEVPGTGSPLTVTDGVTDFLNITTIIAPGATAGGAGEAMIGANLGLGPQRVLGWPLIDTLMDDPTPWAAIGAGTFSWGLGQIQFTADGDAQGCSREVPGPFLAGHTYKFMVDVDGQSAGFWAVMSSIGTGEDISVGGVEIGADKPYALMYSDWTPATTHATATITVTTDTGRAFIFDRVVIAEVDGYGETWLGDVKVGGSILAAGAVKSSGLESGTQGNRLIHDQNGLTINGNPIGTQAANVPAIDTPTGDAETAINAILVAMKASGQMANDPA